MTTRLALALAAITCLALAGGDRLGLQAAPSSQDPRPTAAVSSSRAMLDKYCVTCHNGRLKTAGLALDALDPERPAEHAPTWEKVVRKLRSGAMPPARLPRPDKATNDAVAASIESALDRAATAKPDAGRPAIHRLNRVEYANVIRDLLALEIDSAALLPADDSVFGFDNIADVLSVSPGLLERYMSAAGKISRLAIGDPAIRPEVDTYEVSKFLRQEDRVSDDLPFGSRGGTAIRHYFPLDGEYVIRITLRRNLAEYVQGLNEANRLDVRIDGARVKLFTVGGKFNGMGHSKPQGDDYGAESTDRQIYERTADTDLVVRVPVQAGTRLVAVMFEKRTSEAMEGVGPANLPASNNAFYRAVNAGDPWVDTVEIMGPENARAPQDTPSRRRLFVCRPTGRHDEDACAKQILSTVAHRAYRRPVTGEDIDTLLGFYRDARRSATFDVGIERALRRVLIDPDFLFRVERDPANVAPGAVYRLSDLELASRLSFFLWSSIPDDELLDVAARGKLSDAATLQQQVRRMLGDPRSAALVTNFAGQWLYLRNIRRVTPDPKAFPEFDDNLRAAFQRETELFLESQIREDRSVLELLSANYTFVNERLARHYQIPNISGNHFRRVTFSDDTRGGLLGQGSILTVTSYATRTTPTLRGKWLLENLLGAPPPPPPANVPALQENDEDGGRALSVRDRLEQHRKNPVCASCHAQMDPLGFALENFDAIGAWRTTDANAPIDASAGLPDGTTFQGVAGLRRVLLGRPNEFVRTLSEKLLMYATGRGVESYDAPAIRKLTREAAAGDFRWSSIILGITSSLPFQMRTAQETLPADRSQARRLP